MAASFNSGSDSTQYVDSGATIHITNDLNNLSMHSDYQDKEQVSIGNGQGLTIAHTGSSLVHTSPSSSSPKLNNILHVPSVGSNLLFIHRFTKDNDCVFIFDSFGFSIQGQTSGRILFQGLSNNGLYPFPVLSMSTTTSALLGVKTTLLLGILDLDIPLHLCFKE